MKQDKRLLGEDRALGFVGDCSSKEPALPKWPPSTLETFMAPWSHDECDDIHYHLCHCDQPPINLLCIYFPACRDVQPHQERKMEIINKLSMKLFIYSNAFQIIFFLVIVSLVASLYLSFHVCLVWIPHFASLISSYGLLCLSTPKNSDWGFIFCCSSLQAAESRLHNLCYTAASLISLYTLIKVINDTPETFSFNIKSDIL